MKPYIKNRLWIVGIAILLIFINKADFTAYASKLYSVLLPVIIAFLFAWFLLPLKKHIEKIIQNNAPYTFKKTAHILSACIVYISFIAVIAVFVICFIPIITNSFSSMWMQFEKYKHITEKFLSPDTINKIIAKINPQIYINGAKGTISVIINIIMSFAILIYVLLEHKSIKKSCSAFLSFILGNEKAEQSLYYIAKVNIIFSKYFYSKFISSLLLGVITTAGFFAGGVNYSVFFGTIVALSNMIPVFGMFISTISIALLTFAECGFFKTLLSVTIIFAAQQIENNIITPKIVGDTVGLSGFWILVTTIIGGGLFGFWGLLICIPVAAALKMLFEEFAKKSKKTF